ncbi:MAG: YbaY family lipoprotein [Chloroflexi bacterium]|nr:YbaY family lipoprotein [Chloroflexota bacterium]
MSQKYKKNLLVDQKNTPKNLYRIGILILVGFVFAVLAASCSSTGSTEEVPISTPAELDIFQPSQGARLDTTDPITVQGLSAGLPEGDLLVQALDQDGQILAQEAVSIESSEAGTGVEVPWSVELSIEVAVDTPGQIYAFSPSPTGNSPLVSSVVDVTFDTREASVGRVRLKDHHWLLETLGEAEVMEDVFITAEFDLQMEGFAGCNLYSAYYEQAYGTFVVRGIAPSNFECSEPEGLMQQEARYFQLLDDSGSFAIEDGRLKVFDKSGQLALVYHAGVLGGIFNDEGLELPANAVVNLSLSDVTEADPGEVLVAEITVNDPAFFPISFVVPYDPAQIDPHRSYALLAEIHDDTGKLIFSSISPYHVITQGNPSVADLVIESVQ